MLLSSLKCLYATLNNGQNFSSTYATAVIEMITRIVIFQPSLSMYFGGNPYPTGIALIDVGSIYDKLTPIDAI